jgi:DNA-binding CsgD family transcriptional regulator
MPTAIVGRDLELAAVRDFVAFDASSPARTLVFSGGPGIGKTTLWEAGIGMARERGVRVLTVRTSGAEARLSFAALIDLCDGVDLDALAGLPAPQRSALEVVLLRAEPKVVRPGPGAIAFGFLNTLRELAAGEPLLVAIDDLQWLDAPSADVLVFAARRLQDDPVGFLLAKRTGRATALERTLERGRLERLEVGPLSLGAMRRLLADQLGLSLSRPLLRHIVESTLGNPLFALEVGRTLVERGIPPAGEDLPVPDAVEDLLGTRVDGLDGPLRRLLLAVALSADLRREELVAIEGADAVEDAVDAGLLRLDGERVRVSHPLLAAAARKRSRPRERRELHRALAAAVADEQFRALHLALATDRPDEQLAATVLRASREACDRGARQRATRLAEHALRLTPPDSPERHERVLELAENLETSGDLQRLTELLEPEIDTLPAGLLRARGFLMLGEGAGPKSVADLDRYLDLALAESQEQPRVRAYVLAKKSALVTASSVSRIAEGEAWALEALALNDGDRDHERLALYSLGWARALSGRAIDDLCERSGVASDTSSYIAASPERIAGQRHAWRGELHAAHAIHARLMSLSDERGEPQSYALMRLHLCELELRAGDWAAVTRRLDEWAESSEKDLLIRPMYQRCRALVAAGIGDVEDAERWATDAIARAEATGSRWDWLESQRARGVTALLAREPERAVECLRAVWEHTEREGVSEPGVFPAAPELVEALVEVGELDAALAVAERLRALAEQHEHPWGLASAKRSRAVVRLAAATYDAAAADELAEAVADYGRLGLGFDSARSLLSLGRAQRRLKQWGAARESLEGAVAAFDLLGSDGWAQLARTELERVGGRRPRASGELTPTEAEIVALAADGLANKEIAQALHLAVHTVEVHLSRAYAKLGVRSRSQLAARLSNL